MSLLGLSLLFSFQSLQAPRLSAEPYRGRDLLGATKNPLGEWASGVSQSIGKLPYRTASVVKSLPVIGSESIALCPHLSKDARDFFALPLSVFTPTQQTPRLSTGQYV